MASDVEYVCKVHCIRLACHLLFARDDIKQFFANAGRQIIGDLMVRAAKVRESGSVLWILFIYVCDLISCE